MGTEYGETLRVCPYSVRMRENTDQSNYEYAHFSRNGTRLCYVKYRNFKMYVLQKLA